MVSKEPKHLVCIGFNAGHLTCYDAALSSPIHGTRGVVRLVRRGPETCCPCRVEDLYVTVVISGPGRRSRAFGAGELGLDC